MIAAARAMAYSIPGLRSLVEMDARRALLVTNDMVSMRPLVVLAIRILGPGRRRIEMVKLAHDMNDARFDAGALPARPRLAGDRRPEFIPPSRRAA